MQANFILFVSDQEKSKEFYCSLLDIEPSLHVPGMTEFQLSENTVLGVKVLSPMGKRDWGDFAGYVKDIDGHIIAFAKKP